MNSQVNLRTKKDIFALTIRATNNVLKGSIVETLLVCGSPINPISNKIKCVWWRDGCYENTCKNVTLTHCNFLLKFIGNLFCLFTTFSFASFIACFGSRWRRCIFRILFKHMRWLDKLNLFCWKTYLEAKSNRTS